VQEKNDSEIKEGSRAKEILECVCFGNYVSSTHDTEAPGENAGAAPCALKMCLHSSGRSERLRKGLKDMRI
jgi:hypothetical protein